MFTFRGSRGQFQSWSGQKSFYSSQELVAPQCPHLNFWLRPSLFCSYHPEFSTFLLSNCWHTKPFWNKVSVLIYTSTDNPEFFWEIKKLLAVTLLKPMRCSESPGKLGHKRTDMTQPMFWMSPIFSKRWSTMELIRAKSNVLYIPHNRCMT